MAGKDAQVFGKGGQLAQGKGEGAGIAAAEIGAAGGSSEEGIAGEQRAVGVQPEADAAGGVAGSFDYGPASAGEFEDGGFADVPEGGWGCGGGIVEAGEEIDAGEAPIGVEGVDENGSGTGLGEGGEGGNVVHVAMGQEVGDDDGIHCVQSGGEAGGVVAGIDDDGFAGGGIGNEVTIFF